MTIFQLAPYAANAIVRHWWTGTTVVIFATFRFSMDETVKPAHALWLPFISGVAKTISASVWLDAYTIQLTVSSIATKPTSVSLGYDGPDDTLRTTWTKQWEPFGQIISLGIPYEWENLLVVYLASLRVGINNAGTAAWTPSYPFHLLVASTGIMAYFQQSGSSHGFVFGSIAPPLSYIATHAGNSFGLATNPNVNDIQINTDHSVNINNGKLTVVNEIRTNNVYSVSGITGITETLNFNGVASGDVLTLVVVGGIITGRTKVP